MKVRVSQDAINHGVPRCEGWCPIALAIKLDHPYITIAGVSGKDVVVSNGESVQLFELPEEAKEFVARFDNNETVKPITFNLIRKNVMAYNIEFYNVQ